MLRQGERGLGAARDHVHDGLGLYQVDPPVQEGALGELAGLRQSGPGIDHQGQDAGDHQGAAVALDLDHILAGIGVGCLHVDQHGLVQHVIGSRVDHGTIRKTVAF